jgi:hypothetical protein
MTTPPDESDSDLMLCFIIASGIIAAVSEDAPEAYSKLESLAKSIKS